MATRNRIFFRQLLLNLAIAATAAGALAFATSQGSQPSKAINALASTSSTPFPAPTTDAALASMPGTKTVVFAGGCFWGMEAVFEHVQGVTDVVSGYSGGSAESANYGEVSAGRTEHAEAVQVTYDPSKVTYGQLLKVYFSVAHDPTEVDRQGPDVGRQYRSAIFWGNQEERAIAQSYIAQLNEAGIFDAPIATQLAALDRFYAAEEYHQDFITHNPNYPYVVIHDLPKIARLQAQFPEMYVE